MHKKTKRQNKVYGIVTNEYHQDFAVSFCDNYIFACAALSVHETFSSLKRAKKSDLSKDELQDCVFFQDDEDFKQYILEHIDQKQ